MAVIEAPERVGTRSRAHELLAQLLASETPLEEVALDCGRLVASAPSFLDEVVKLLLVDREVGRLRLLGASPRIAFLASRSAKLRNVAHKLVIETSERP